jgi:hypothetical protein
MQRSVPHSIHLIKIPPSVNQPLHLLDILPSNPPCVSCVQTPSRSLPACVCVLGAARLKLVGLVAWAILLSCCRLCCVGHACLFHQTLPPLSGASIAPLGTDLLGVGAWVSCSLDFACLLRTVLACVRLAVIHCVRVHSRGRACDIVVV